MCCSVNQFSVCKAIALIVGIILGVAVGLLVGFFPVLLTNAITVLWIIFGITLLVFIFTAALSVYGRLRKRLTATDTIMCTAM